MRVIVALGLLAFFSCATISSADPPTTTVSRGLIIPVVTTREMDTGTFSGQAPLPKGLFEAAQDVVQNGRLILRKGDLVEGHYNLFEDTAALARNWKDYHQPRIVILDDLVNYCGDTLHLEFEHSYDYHVYTKGVSVFTKSHIDGVVVPAGTVFEAKTDRPQRNVCAEKTREANPPLPANMVQPNDPEHPSTQ